MAKTSPKSYVVLDEYRVPAHWDRDRNEVVISIEIDSSFNRHPLTEFCRAWMNAALNGRKEGRTKLRVEFLLRRIYDSTVPHAFKNGKMTEQGFITLSRLRNELEYLRQKLDAVLKNDPRIPE